MKSHRDPCHFLTASRLASAALIACGLSACAAGTSSVAPYSTAARGAQSAARTARIRVDAAQCPSSVVYVVSARAPVVEIYDLAHLHAGPCGTVSGLSSPQGIFVDAKAGLWVTDAVAQAVYEFVPGNSAPALTLSDPNGVPVDVVRDEHSGITYVTEYKNNVNAETLVEVYAKGSTVPTATLSDPAARNGGYDAIDSAGNLYVSFMTQDNKAQVDRWAGGSGSPQNLQLQLISDGGIATTASGALAMCDPFAFRCGIFNPGATKMSNVFGHMGRRQEGGADKPPWLNPDTLALSRSERVAYVISESLTTWTYPGPEHRPNHLPVAQIDVPGLANYGVAVSPAAKPGAPF
jgi:hypothetical protein